MEPAPMCLSRFQSPPGARFHPPCFSHVTSSSCMLSLPAQKMVTSLVGISLLLPPFVRMSSLSQCIQVYHQDLVLREILSLATFYPLFDTL